MNGDKVILTGDKLRAAMQAHFRAFVADVRVTVNDTGVVALEVHFAQQPLPLRADSGPRHH